MFNLFSKYFILMNLILLSIISLFMNDFMNIWFLMEINNFLFISYMAMYMNNKKMIFFYFLIQIIPSMILIFSISLNLMNMFDKKMITYLIYLSLMVKLGIPPFHFWMPLLSLYLFWDMLFFLLTIQKIIPFYMFSLINMKNFQILLILFMCSVIPPLMMLNLLNLKKLLTYSSINQSGWLMLLIYFKNILWLTYLMLYTFIMMIMFFMLSFYKIFYNFLNINNFNLNLFTIIMILNMASMPPFSFFILKWFSIFIMMNNSFNLFMMMILMIFSSFFMFFLYINMLYLNMFINISKSKLYSYQPNYLKISHMFLYFFIIILSPIIMII
ncbi:NADH dehydrogenase subunit 2 (mitochondrion) [Linepithema humile]|uniref:NADH-ubiquinone oxidoreductase chain 2 n=1 Tax=Linepithema humile TaxID=83485 RepID=A0A191TFT0_LINHU|nr:NADH dehydrogenase subunit 2 [Linepithema humile]ANI87486.1 NADH dehydrogenase subunit 2 [Linepithema humile]QNV47336.1 NADH dehydrogenase subunit 2 [Linepithema humile]